MRSEELRALYLIRLFLFRLLPKYRQQRESLPFLGKAFSYAFREHLVVKSQGDPVSGTTPHFSLLTPHYNVLMTWASSCWAWWALWAAKVGKSTTASSLPLSEMVRSTMQGTPLSRQAWAMAPPSISQARAP